MSDETAYNAARAAEERRLAMASDDPKVRKIHLEMAAKYAVLASATTQAVDEEPPEAEQQTA